MTTDTQTNEEDSQADARTVPQSPSVTSKPENTTPPPNIKPGLDASDGQAVPADDSDRPE